MFKNLPWYIKIPLVPFLYVASVLALFFIVTPLIFFGYEDKAQEVLDFFKW